MYIYIYTYIHIQIYIYICIYIHTYLFIYIYVSCIYTLSEVFYLHHGYHIGVGTTLYCVHIYTCRYIVFIGCVWHTTDEAAHSIRIYIYTGVYTFIYIHIYIYICIYYRAVYNIFGRGPWFT